MAKTTTISSDIDFIREVEELKLKQKLLVESLKKKNSNEQNQLFLEINSKLDFLVKIFSEANKHDEEENEEEKIDFETKFSEVDDKIDKVSKNLGERFDTIEKLLKEIKVNTNQIVPQKVDLNSEVANIAQNRENAKENLPPAPDFKVDENKKKKWF